MDRHGPLRRTAALVAGLVATAAVVAVAAGAVTGSRSEAPAPVGTVTTSPPPSTTAVSAPATTEVPAAGGGTGAATGQSRVVSDESVTAQPEAGVVVTNYGSATADVGGNVVSGGDPPSSVVTGPATAVGNVSSTEVHP